MARKIDLIRAAITRRGAGYLAGSLNDAIEAEAEALCRPPRTPRARKAAREDAEAYYAEEIADAFYNGVPPTPDQILTHRRKAIAWAIARKLRDIGVEPGEV